MDENGGVNFERFWGDRERLEPVGSVEIEHIGDRDRIPFRIEIKPEVLKKYLDDEGIVGGGRVMIKVDYPKKGLLGKMLRGGKEESPFIDGEVSLSNIVGGVAKKVKGGIKVIELNATAIYDLALVTPNNSNEELELNYQRLLGLFLGHEIQHLRQPGREANEYHQFKYVKHGGLWGVLEKIGTNLKLLNWREIEARSIGGQSKEKLRQAIELSTRNAEMLQRDNFWARSRQLGSDLKSTISEGFKQ